MQIVNHNLWYARILINNTHVCVRMDGLGHPTDILCEISTMFIEFFSIFFQFFFDFFPIFFSNFKWENWEQALHCALAKIGVIRNIFAINSQHFMGILTECRPLSRCIYVKNSWKSVSAKNQLKFIGKPECTGHTSHRLRLMNMMLLHNKVLLCAHSKTPWRKMLFAIIPYRLDNTEF